MVIDISVIIPVYNPPHDMFEKCICSLLSQTGELGLEFIFVNDGSTDGWIAERLERLEQEDSRVVVITKENEGVSVARNIGMETAKGEYIAFVDSDDYVLDGGLEYMHRETSRHGAEIGMFGFTSDSLNDINIEHWSDIVEGEKKAAMIKEIVAEYGNMPFFNKEISIFTLWAKLYRRDFLMNNNIRFMPGVEYDEDAVFNLGAAGKAEKVFTDNRKTYHYETVSGSLSNSYCHEKIGMSEYTIGEKKRLLKEIGQDRIEIFEALYVRAFLNVMRTDIDYLCDINIDTPLRKRHKDFCRHISEGIMRDCIRCLSIETLKRYSINSKSQLARLYIYKYKLVWILTAKTWIKQKIRRQ